MRRLAELLKTDFHSSRRAGMSLAIVSLLVFTLFALSSFAQAQTPSIITSDFEDGQLDGWVQNGSPTTLAASTDMAHSGTHSLKIVKSASGQGYDGASMDFRSIMSAGDAWEFSVWVRLAPGQPADTIFLQFRDSSSTVWGGYPPATPQMTVTDQGWVLLKGRYPGMGNGTYPGGASELKIYFATGKGTTSFYADDFVAYKIQPTGCSNPEDTTGVQTTFEDGLEGWFPRQGSNMTVSQSNADAHGGSYSLLETARTGNWTVGAYDATGKMCNGSRYIIHAWVKMAAGKPDTQISLGGQLKKGATTSYPTFVSSQTVTANAWTEFKTTYDMASDYDELLMFFQPDSDSSSDFYIDDFSITYVPPAATIEPIPSIGQAYKDYFPVGAAIYAPGVTPGDIHSDLLALHFTSVTAENDMKWSATEASENVFDYTKADEIVAFAKSHNMAVRGHALVWHQQTPDWVFKDANGADMSTLPYSDANKTLLMGRMKNHIQALIAHFGADVTSWDVVNEPFDETQADGFRRSKWYTIYGGPGYIDDAFKYAKEAVDAAGLTRKVKLYLNEYNTNITGKLNFLTAYLSAAKTAGVPIDGVGHQFHYKLDWPVNDDPNSIKAVTGPIDAVATLGFDNQITEMDLSIYRAGSTASYPTYADIVANQQNDLVIQGYRYRDYFSAFKTLATEGKLSSVTLWGEADDHTWLTSLSKADAPLPFDNNLIHKPAYTGIMDAESLPNALPYSADASVEVIYNKQATITLHAGDANLDPLTLSIVAQPTHGSLSAISGSQVTYTPATDYAGPDTFSFSANDGKGDGNVATVTLNVVGPPVADDKSVTTDLNAVANITLTATTTGQAPLSYSVVTQPTHGSLSGVAPNLTYTPTKDYWGADSFTFKANNGTDSNIATVSITVLPSTATPKDQSVTVEYGEPTPITLTATGNGTMNYVIVTQPKEGTLTQTTEGSTTTWTYTTLAKVDPRFENQADSQEDSFTFKVNNGHDSAIATVKVHINAAILKVKLASGESTSKTVSAGGTATYNLQVAGYGSWRSWSTGGVSFVCGGLPNYASCTVTPSQVSLPTDETVPETTAIPFTVTVRTNTPGGAGAGSTSTPASWPRNPWLPVALIATAVLALAAMRKAKMQWRFVGACAVLLVVASFPGCGGNSTTSKNTNDMVSTPAGTYTITVTAVSTRNLSGEQKSDWKITGEIPLTLTVN